MKQHVQVSSRFRSAMVSPLLLTLAMLVVVGFVYAAVHYQYRQGANDPQIELAGDLAADMSAGSLAQDAVGPYAREVNPRSSLATFAVITDANGKVLASSLKMNGTTPLPPKGVLAASGLSHQNRLTWQPEPGTRIALVVQAYQHDANTGYVLVGRSLAEVERRVDMLSWLGAVVAGAVMLLGIAATLSARLR